MATKGKFWYSERQKRNMQLSADKRMMEPVFAKLTDGRIVEYTEMKSGQRIDEPSLFEDAICLGEGVTLSTP